MAAPTTTLDPSLAAGSQIVIEERSPQELTHFQGRPVAAGGVQVCWLRSRIDQAPNPKP